jgi:hypothetical protein
MKYLVLNLACIVCFGIAGALAFNGQDGWGWFLFAGVVIFCYPTDDED